jgi:hypothetical protein
MKSLYSLDRRQRAFQQGFLGLPLDDLLLAAGLEILLHQQIRRRGLLVVRAARRHDIDLSRGEPVQPIRGRLVE